MTNSTISSSGCARPMLGENPRNPAARHSRAICSAAATISAKDTWLEMTIVERVARNVDHAAVQRMQQDEAERATAERIAALRHIVFRNAASNRNVQALTNETAAARLLTSAGNSADGFLVLGILRVAIDKRWHSVILAGIRYFWEHPVAARIQELWNLTTDRETV